MSKSKDVAAAPLHGIVLQPRPSADEVCRMLELMSMFADEDDKSMSFVYRMTHIREGGASCEHESWIAEFRKHAEYWENANKAPADNTKRQDLEYPCL
jgi:hypothetical protein